MHPIPVAILLYGKMVYRSFYSRYFQNVLIEKNLEPFFFLDSESAQPNDKHQLKFETTKYSKLENNPYTIFANNLRWYMIQNPSTEIRFRGIITDSIFQSNNLSQTLLKALALDTLRQFKFLANPLTKIEEIIGKTNVHNTSFRENNVKAVLLSGIGGRDFQTSGYFAREALSEGIPVVAAITNYDNLLSRGYRSFTPTKTAVWSKKMLEQATKLMDLPQKDIAITGPIVFDRYFNPIEENREEFLSRRGLDPDKKTVLYATHSSNTSTFFDFLRIVKKLHEAGEVLAECNIVIRPYPLKRLYEWTGLEFFMEKISEYSNVYISNPFEGSPDSIHALKKEETSFMFSDELHGLLKYSDVMVNYFSTLGLEAAVCDLPTIHIAYDNYTHHVSPLAWCSIGASFVHNQDSDRIAASKIVHSDDELIKALTDYLSNRNMDQDARLNYALAECGYLDGKASHRLADLLQCTAEGKNT